MYKYIMMPAAIGDLQQIGDYISNDLCAPESAVALMDSMRVLYDAQNYKLML